ncbi:MAG: hypothetical protein FJ087_00680 [Deltaproteobacteria bacterium]|nr:hypothetical protein [Deltaproteobacteria bacterium]
MKIQFLRPDLHQIDRVTADTVVVSVFEEERPPRGVSGLMDWRLCGRLSRLMVGGQVTGRFREAVLLPAYGRLPASRVCAYGMGRLAEFSPARAREASWFVADSLHKLRTSSFVTSLPGSPLTGMAARPRMELFLEELIRVFGADETSGGVEAFIVEPAELHRDLTDAVSVAMRKLRVMWK